MRKEEFYIKSRNGKDQLYCNHWLAEGQTKAVVQIAHGMIEHIRRYEAFARFLNEHQIAVIGHDHLGHGYSAKEAEDRGYFSDQDGSNLVIRDMYQITRYARKRYPGIPIILLGHSMGSFFARKYMTVFGNRINGVILLGTGSYTFAEAAAGKALAAVIGKIKGKRFRSRLLYELMLGSMNRKIPDARTPHDWLSRDTKAVDEYEQDELCQFQFSAGACSDFFLILAELASKKYFDRIPKLLPVFLASGKEDPVGDYGKGVEKVYKQFVSLGIRDLEIKLYDGMRHELLNEVGKEEVYDDILSWLEKRF
ncbi:MAG: alpha/beta fold hydrolase [Lachnospiraceae bacterium]